MRLIPNSMTLACSLIFATMLQAASTPAFSMPQGGIVEKHSTPSLSPDRKKVGLALGGGGTRGAAHVTVLKVLKENGIPIDYIAGTSMGAVVGGMYAAGVPLNDIESKFKDCSLMKSFMTVPLGVRIVAAPIMLLPRLWSHPYDGLYRGNKFRNYLVDSMPSTGKNIEDLKIPYCAVALSLIDGKPHRISSGSLGYAMQASSAVPGLRKPVEINNNLFVDGGVAANVPVNQCREMGADIVIAVCVDERFDGQTLNHFRKIGSVSKRMVTWDLYDMDERLMSGADIVIHPNVNGIGLISTKKSDAKKALAAGTSAAQEMIPAIKRKLEEAGVGMAGITNPASLDR